MASDKSKGRVEVGEAMIEITPEVVDKLRQRLGDTKAGARKLWFRRCECACGCPISHPGRDKKCILCRDGDHWTTVVETLDRIMNREES